jgi:glycosyltransferase involved in cell wall biosynthesis
LRVGVVTSAPPGVEGGHLAIARALAAALQRSGRDAEVVITPDYGFGKLTRTYRAAHATDVSRFDQVISLRYPSFAVTHARQTCWLNHTMREYYDLWPAFAASISWRNWIKESIRRSLLHAADRHLLRNVTRVVAQSKTIQARVASDFGIRADVVYPPAPHDGYRCERYGDYIFSVSRLDPLKRVDLLIRAMAELPARHVRAVVAGDGEDAADLRALATHLGVADRVTFIGRVDDEAMLRHYAQCRAVCFTPYAEDYGFVTIEAFASGKGVITCRDSGGPAELVADDVNGAVCEPTPASIAIALARLADDRVLAERFGAAAAARAATITWHDAVTRLLL